METYEDFYLDIDRILLAHRFVMKKNNVCDYSQGRRSFGLLYVISGSAVFSFADRTYTVKPGDMVFLTPESNYTSTAQELFEHYTINFSVNRDTCYGDIVLRQLFASEWHILHVGNDSLCLSLFSELCDTWKQKQAGYRMLCMARLYQLTSDFILKIMTGQVDSFHFKSVLPAKEYLDSHFRRDISLSVLAHMCSMSCTNFRRIFLSVFGETPLQYRDRICLLRAQDYLTSGLYTVSQVAEKCGFQDVNYFSRFFKKHTHVSPSVYRNTRLL